MEGGKVGGRDGEGMQSGVKGRVGESKTGYTEGKRR